MDILFTLGSFVVALAILIAVHEFGHFWVARQLGVKVLRFSIGFGTTLLRWQPRETEYVLAAIPFGGYVRMLDEREETVAAHELHRAFNRQPVWKRSAIVIAGPLCNFLFAILAYWAIFMAGETGLRPIIGAVTPDSAAAAADLRSGDELLAIGARPARSWEDAALAFVAGTLAGQDLVLRIQTGEGTEAERRIPGTALAALAGHPDPLAALGLAPRQPVLPAVIGELVPGEPAALAGLQPGDRILAVDGQPVADWRAWVALVRERPRQALRLDVERAPGERLALTLTPRPVDADGVEIGRVGAGVQVPDDFMAADRVVVRHGPLEALSRAADKTLDMSLMTLRMVGRLLTGRASIENLSGPIAIAETAGRTASHGLDAFVKFLAIVSISLGVLNLLPVPVLDGGHLLYFLIEALQGRPLSEQAQLQGQRLGLVLLAGLMTLAFYVDLSRLLG